MAGPRWVGYIPGYEKFDRHMRVVDIPAMQAHPHIPRFQMYILMGIDKGYTKVHPVIA
jgi:hypothetical protein